MQFVYRLLVLKRPEWRASPNSEPLDTYQLPRNRRSFTKRRRNIECSELARRQSFK
jgi:hypothetical protein